ncbi:hypothetical protein R6Q57_028719 [Mikania cordata]
MSQWVYKIRAGTDANEEDDGKVAGSGDTHCQLPNEPQTRWNKGRGQIYPDRSKSNNTVYNVTASGIVSKILRKEKGEYEITIADASDRRQVVDIIPPGPELLVSEGKSIKLDQPLSSPIYIN